MNYAGASELILGRTVSARRGMGFAFPARSKEGGELITYAGDGHLITFAPTGTGKTSGPVITNALHHRGQLIVVDMKGETYAATATARRAMGQEICVIDLRDGGEKGSLNPLDLALRSGTDIAVVARSFAAEVVERTGMERDRFWTDWSETLIAGGLAWLLEDCPAQERRLSKLFDLFVQEDPVYDLAVKLDTKAVRNRAAVAAFSSFLQLPERDTRPSVLGTVQAHLRLFDSELTRKLTDTTTIDLDGFVDGKPMSVYIIVPPFRLHAYAPLLRLWVSCLILTLTQRKRPPKERTLMLCDEIGNLGRIEGLLTASTLLRSWGLTLWTFWQNAAQLQLYGTQANTLVDNAGVIQIFGARNYRMAQDLSNLIGGISADEILRLPGNEQVLLIESKLLRCKQLRHYEDQMFRNAS